jgi:hypothetical protein
MATFAVIFLYMPSMKPSMMTAIVAPITSAIQVLVWLYQAWSKA